MLRVVTNGKPGTAMKGFGKVLDRAQISLVVDFVRREFMELKRPNTRYHTEENGWPDHERYRPAFGFALGDIPTDTPLEQLTPEQRLGWRVFMDSCVSCHDRARVRDEGRIWDARPLSFPRGGYDHRTGTRPRADGVSGASPYAIHDRAPRLDGLSPRQRQGEALYQNNCAFCHAADGSGRNWIGSFLAAPPRDLRSAQVRAMTDQALLRTVREGLPGTTMSAWKNVLEDDQIRAIIDYIRVAFATEPQRQ